MQFISGVVNLGKGEIVNAIERSNGTIDMYISSGKKTYYKNFEILGNGKLKLNSSVKASFYSEVIPLATKKIIRVSDSIKIV